MPSEIDVMKIIPLQDGQELTFGETIIKCIKAPGHTKGSMVYLVDGKYLFTGDAFKIENGNIKVHPYTFSDRNVAKKTIKQLKKMIDDNLIIFTSHFGIYNNNKN